MNYCWLALKAIQLALSLLIAVLFLVPQTLTVNDDALESPGKTNLTKVDTEVTARHLVCGLIEYDFYDAQPEWLGVKPNVEFPDDLERPNKQTLDQIRKTLGCLQFWNGTKSDCLCWGDFYILFVVGISCFTAVTTLCDIASIFAAEHQDAQIQGSQGTGSCACSIITGVIWVVTGGIVAYYVYWMYVTLQYFYHFFLTYDSTQLCNYYCDAYNA